MLLINILKDYWKSIAVVTCILYLSFASPAAFDKIPSFPNEDKLIHVLMYAGLSFILIFDFKRTVTNNRNLLAFVLICLTFPVLLGGAVEIIQGLFFAPRTPSWLDWLADIVGVFVGWLGIKLMSPIMKL